MKIGEVDGSGKVEDVEVEVLVAVVPVVVVDRRSGWEWAEVRRCNEGARSSCGLRFIKPAEQTTGIEGGGSNGVETGSHRRAIA